MFEQVFTHGPGAAVESPAEVRRVLEGAETYVVRSPEIVWIADAVDEGGAVERGQLSECAARAIAEEFGEIDRSLRAFRHDRAENACWRIWSLCQAVGAPGLAERIQSVAIALDSNDQLADGSFDVLRRLLAQARAAFGGTDIPSAPSAERAA